MEKDNIKERAYLEGLKSLRGLISADYAAGGWLPPGRKMCERFKISHTTYCKATRRLVDEGTAVSYPRKGHYIKPASLRVSKVGFVLGDGAESPFIRSVLFDILGIELLVREGLSHSSGTGKSLGELATQGAPLRRQQFNLVSSASIRPAYNKKDSLRRDFSLGLLLCFLTLKALMTLTSAALRL